MGFKTRKPPLFSAEVIAREKARMKQLYCKTCKEPLLKEKLALDEPCDGCYRRKCIAWLEKRENADSLSDHVKECLAVAWMEQLSDGGEVQTHAKLKNSVASPTVEQLAVDPEYTSMWKCVSCNRNFRGKLPMGCPFCGHHHSSIAQVCSGERKVDASTVPPEKIAKWQAEFGATIDAAVGDGLNVNSVLVEADQTVGEDEEVEVDVPARITRETINYYLNHPAQVANPLGPLGSKVIVQLLDEIESWKVAAEAMEAELKNLPKGGPRIRTGKQKVLRLKSYKALQAARDLEGNND